MSQVLRHLIVIINLIPSCLCFAQEGANKTPPASAAQKPETELQRPNSAQGQNPTVVLPAGMGAFQIVGLSPEANSCDQRQLKLFQRQLKLFTDN